MPAATSTDRLARLVSALIWIAIAAVCLVVVRGEVFGRWPFQPAVDPSTGTATISVTTDAGTGCQYVLTPLGGIAPRTGRDGKQVCSPPAR